MGSKTVLVIGATGAQGGSVARHLLANRDYHVRALTRNVNSEAAQRLRHAGAELVEGTLDQVHTLRVGLQGCNAVFGVTNYWEHFERERVHAKNLVDAVAESGVDQFIFSTLPSAKKMSGGAVECEHLDIKAEAEEYARSKGLRAIYVHVSFYYENFLNYFPPQRRDDGTYAFGFPQGDTPLAAVAVDDVGGVVASVLARFDSYEGMAVGVTGDELTPEEYADVMSDHLGRVVEYEYIPRETYATFGFPGAADLANMFELNRVYMPSRRADIRECTRLYPGLQNFSTWMERNYQKFEPLLATASA